VSFVVHSFFSPIVKLTPVPKRTNRLGEIDLWAVDKPGADDENVRERAWSAKYFGFCLAEQGQNPIELSKYLELKCFLKPLVRVVDPVLLLAAEDSF
jgi:hypothetical protein